MRLKMVILFLVIHGLYHCDALNQTVNLVALDQHLTSLLVHPQTGKGNELLNDSEFLCKSLDEVSDLVDEQDPKGAEIYNRFAKAGGLKFINTTYNSESLKKGYKFTDDDLEYLSTTIREMKSVWLSIEVLLNVTLPDSGEHYREKILARIRENEILRGEPDTNVTSMETSELSD
ncbi:hypothetical protein J6590_058664 [Homalodisca vitripennis]|nr:hypothetical protein J6590_058664 [Homalodisca vitripennis]